MEHSFTAIQKGSLMGNLVFLLLALPLGIFYFTLTVVGISLGMGTLVIWIGLPILFVTLLITRGMAEIERRMVNSLLHIPIPYALPAQNEPSQSFLRRFGRILSDPYTWTSMIYALLKLPLGILSFTVTITFLALSAALTLFPLAYLINLLVNTILFANGVISDGIMIPGFIEVHTSFDTIMFAKTLLIVPLGLAFWFMTRFLIANLARFTGELARALLGPGVAYIAAQPHVSYMAPISREKQQVYTD